MPKDEEVHSVADNGGNAPLGSLVANVGARIQEMLDTAERVAGEIRADAEAAGRTYLQERQRDADRVVQERMAELDQITQSLAARAANMEHEMTAFVAEVEQIRWRMGRLIGEDGPPAESAPAGSPTPGMAVQSPARFEPAASQDAALRATQMAVAGAERADIEQMLRDQFGMDDPSAIDRVLHNGNT
jgi:hypothetical protein